MRRRCPGSARHALRALKPRGVLLGGVLLGGVLLAHAPGEGHAALAVSQQAVRVHGANERDRAPRRIIRVGREIGFVDRAICPMHERLLDIFHRPGLARPCLRGKLRLLRCLASLISSNPGRGSAIVRMARPAYAKGGGVPTTRTGKGFVA
jgi:hypothetical protein